MKTLFTGIRQLLTFAGEIAPRAGAAQREIGLIKNAAVLAEDPLIGLDVAVGRDGEDGRLLEVNAKRFYKENNRWKIN